MSPTLNESSAIRRFEGSDAIVIRGGITFDFYTGLPHMQMLHEKDTCGYYQCKLLLLRFLSGVR